jgi:hypothetical protein
MLYKEEETTIYRRANTVVINNELGLTPDITFHEQYATVGGEAINGRLGSCSLALEEGSEETFTLVHPELGVKLGEMSYLELQVAIYSLYLHAADKRDNPPAPVVEEESEETEDGPTE